MITLIAFDLGGVLFTEGKSIAMKTLSDEHGYDPAIVLDALSSPMSIDLRKGTVADETFWSWTQKQLPEGYDAQLIKQTWYDSYQLDKDIYQLVKGLQSKYTLMIFSGNIEGRINHLEKKYQFRQLFDKELYSYQCNATKPEEKFVEIMLEQAGVAPEKILYVDDSQKAIDAGKKYSVHTALYQTGRIDELLNTFRSYDISV